MSAKIVIVAAAALLAQTTCALGQTAPTGASPEAPPDSVLPPKQDGRPCRPKLPFPVQAILSLKNSVATVLSYIIEADGSVRNVIVARSSGNDSLDLYAAACVADRHYEPATQNGHPVEEAWRAEMRWN